MDEGFPKNFKADDGVILSCWVERPTGRAKAAVVVVHGLGEQSQTLPYQNLTDHLLAHDISVYRFDLRGHGVSGGRRMFTPAWEQFRRDLAALVRLVKGDASSIPIFLLGMSLGGLIAIDYSINHPDGLRGVVVVAPALSAEGVPRPLRSLLRLVSRVAPTIAMDPGLDLTNITRDKAALDAYTKDKDFQTKVTARLAAEVFRGISTTSKLAASLDLPILVLHGEADSIVPLRGSRKFFDQVVFADKEFQSYPGAFHNLLLEPDRNEYFSDIISWIDAH